MGFFKRDFKEASEGADRRLGSREFHTDETAAVKARDANYEATGVVWPADGPTVGREGVSSSECLALKRQRSLAAGLKLVTH